MLMEGSSQPCFCQRQMVIGVRPSCRAKAAFDTNGVSAVGERSCCCNMLPIHKRGNVIFSRRSCEKPMESMVLAVLTVSQIPLLCPIMLVGTIGITALSRQTGHNRRTLHRWVLAGKIPSEFIASRKRIRGRDNGFRFWVLDGKLSAWAEKHAKPAEDRGVPGRSAPVIRRAHQVFENLGLELSGTVSALDFLETLRRFNASNAGNRSAFAKLGRRLGSQRKQELIAELEKAAALFSGSAARLKR